MSAKQPWELKSSLTEDRLNFLGKQFWEVYYGVDSLLNTADDCNYGRGALFFGRSRQRLINLGLKDEIDWLKLTNPGMDVTLEIDNSIPFRFFRDDHDNPKKKGFWRRNDSDQLFAPNDQEPVIFRFIVQRPLNDDEELEIYFIGYNALEEAVCEWRYGQVPILRSVDQGLPHLPNEVEQQPASVDIPQEDVERNTTNAKPF